jgi:DNA replication protein DnaC
MAKAQHAAALRQHEARLTAANDELALATERDALQAARPPDCRCLGMGVLLDQRWCTCPEGLAREAEYERAAAVAEVERQAQVAIESAARERHETQDRQERANIPPHYREATFETFPFELEKAVVVQHLAELSIAREPRRGAYLWGDFGVGKTGLACAALNARILTRRPCLFVTVSAFLDWVRRTYDRQSAETTDSIMAKVQTTPFLVLDDLGAEYLTRWGRDRLFAILNHRDTHDLVTIVTSNYSPGEIAVRLAGDDDLREGKRLVWRILECCDVLELRGRNLRERGV